MRFGPHKPVFVAKYCSDPFDRPGSKCTGQRRFRDPKTKVSFLSRSLLPVSSTGIAESVARVHTDSVEILGKKTIHDLIP